MSSTDLRTLHLLAEIIVILSNNNSYWSLCGGAQNRVGLTSAELLPLLEDNNPIWTELLLSQILKIGLRLGTLRQQKIGSKCVTSSSTNGQYFINLNMLSENNINTYFKSIINNLPQP
jgi:hypothetical protein